MSDQSPSKSANLRVLIHRRDKVLAVMHPPTAAHARIMEKAGCGMTVWRESAVELNT